MKRTLRSAVRPVCRFVSLFLFPLCAAFAADGGVLQGPEVKAPQILMVVTSHGSLGDAQTGLWLEEFAVPYRLFREAGFRVVVASPRGGRTPVDPRSLTAETRPANSEEALEVLQETLPLDAVDLTQYAAVFFPGGHGTMFDFPDNPAVQKTVEYFLLNQRPTALVCHGPAALVGASAMDGSPLVRGRKIAAFTDDEERAVGLENEVPFLLQSRLEALGAEVLPAENFAEQVVVDGNLVTGQNPASSARAARELLRLLQ